MFRKPRVSVVIPCFNLGAFLDEAVQSVLAQTFQSFEILIVDDGSDDAVTRHLLASYKRPRTRIIATENSGLAAARNRGLAEAKGEYVSFLDADDLYETTFLERTVELLDGDPGIAFASCWLNAFGEATFAWTPETCAFPHLLAEDTVCTAALMRRALLVDVGGFDQGMPVPGYEDWDLALALVERGHRGAIVPESLFRYRIRAGSMTETCAAPENHARLMEYLVAKHENAYREHSRGVMDVIAERIGALEAMLSEPPPERPAIRDDDWRGSLLALERHRRDLEVTVQTPATGSQNGAVEWGSLRRLEPVSRVWGLDRGLPVDRYFIERFLQAERDAIRGDVLEVKDPGYAQRFGSDLGHVEVVDVAAHNPQATLVADLSLPGSLPAERFDCFILTQTLHIIYGIEEVVANAHATLRPGGVLLATVPSVSRIDYESGLDSDFWRLTPASARRLFEASFGAGNVEVQAFGNVLLCTAFLHGLAASELSEAELERHDPYFPLLLAIRAVRGEEEAPDPAAVVGQLEGHLDAATCQVVTGWAWDRSDPGRRLVVELLEGERVLGTAVASGFRADLAEAGKADGRAAFTLVPSVDLHGERLVRATVGGKELAASPRPVQCVCGLMPTQGQPAGTWVAVPEVALDGADLAGSFIDAPVSRSRLSFPWVEIVGWAVSEQGPIAAIELTLEGDVVQRVQPGVPRPDLAAVFPELEWATSSGFAARFSVQGLRSDTTLGVRAVVADGEHASVGRIRLRVSDSPGHSPLVAVIDPRERSLDSFGDVLDQDIPAAILVVGATAPGHPGLRRLEGGIGEALDGPDDALIWLADGDEAAPKDFLRSASAWFTGHVEAAFAMWHDSGDEIADTALEAVLSGTALGRTATFRAAAAREVGGFDPDAPSSAVAVWDLCIRLAAGGKRGLAASLSGPAAPSLPERVGLDGVRWLYRKHEDLYRERLVEVLLDREAAIATFLRHNHALERSIAKDLEPEVVSRRRERDRLGKKLRRAPAKRPHAATPSALDWGDFNRSAPVSLLWGSDRGLCIDRYYIEGFLEAHAADMKGRVLEIHDSIYSERYGGSRLETCDVVDIDATNERADIVADLRHAPELTEDTYDCIILTQTLQVIDRAEDALRECARILKPGGVLLATVPCVSRVDPESGLDGDHWRFTEEGFRALLEAAFAGGVVEVEPRGNRETAAGFLAGLAAEELPCGALDRSDPGFPLLIVARAVAPIAKDES